MSGLNSEPSTKTYLLFLVKTLRTLNARLTGRNIVKTLCISQTVLINGALITLTLHSY